MKIDKHKVHKWTHHVHHFAEVMLAGAVAWGSHFVEVWAIGGAGAAAVVLICLDCVDFSE